MRRARRLTLHSALNCGNGGRVRSPSVTIETDSSLVMRFPHPAPAPAPSRRTFAHDPGPSPAILLSARPPRTSDWRLGAPGRHEAGRNLRAHAVSDREGLCRREQGIYRGEFDSPKTFRSIRWAALGDGLLAWLSQWLEMLPNTRPEAWVFPSERLTTPLSKDNCWRRSFRPRLKTVGLDWAR